VKLARSPLAGHWIIERSPHLDERGRFERLFCAEEYSEVRTNLNFVQVNRSVTRQRGTVRGIHYQRAPKADAKLIHCLRGRVYDVAVDLRSGSPTLGRWHGVELAPDGACAVFVPEGFGHGFQALTDDAELVYLHTAAYEPDLEGGLRYDDLRLGIVWPMPVALVSDRDRQHPPLMADFHGLTC
jgi:dTDP-4-dehydrorhamnose 3,5-epimerase